MNPFAEPEAEQQKSFSFYRSVRRAAGANGPGLCPGEHGGEGCCTMRWVGSVGPSH